MILSLGARPLVSAAAAIAGIVAGEATVGVVTSMGLSIATLVPAAPQFVKDLNVGIVALIVNLVVLTLVALATPRAAHVGAEARAVA